MSIVVSAKQQVRPCQTSWIHETVPCTAETIIVDVSQLFYHIVWPHGGSPSDIIASVKSRLSQSPTFSHTTGTSPSHVMEGSRLPSLT